MNQFDFRQRVAIVTGGARGIGLAVAERLRAGGTTLVLWDVLASEMAKAVAQTGASASAVVDVSDEQQVRLATLDVLERFGQIDILINSAGITGPNHPTWEYPPAEFERVFKVNVTGTFLTTRAVVPPMRARKYGRIINLASLAGKEGTPNASAYSGSKAAIIAMTKSLAKELAHDGVIVNAVAPAAAQTEMLKQMTEQHVAVMLAKSPMNRFAEADEIAGLIAWMASEECSFTTGAVFDCSGGRAVY